MQEKCGLPWVVALDLTTTDTVMLNLASALVVKRLDPPADLEDPPTPAETPPTYYLCLMTDNRYPMTASCIAPRPFPPSPSPPFPHIQHPGYGWGVRSFGKSSLVHRIELCQLKSSLSLHACPHRSGCFVPL